jgi:hypothetical protein
MSLSLEERQQLLTEPLIAALAVDAGSDRGPLNVPIWYQYELGGKPWILTSAGSRKAELIQKTGYFSLMVQRVEPTVRYVTVEGPVARIEPSTPAMLREMAVRYLPAAKVDEYLEFATANHGEQIAIYLEPQRWLSADMGSL